MAWRQRLAGILALMMLRSPRERISAGEAVQPDEPHTEVEAPEPDQVVICEAGLAGSNVTQPSVIVGGTSGVGVQTESQNTPLITGASASPGKVGADFRVTVREGSPSSFQPRRPGYVSGLPNLFKSAIIGTRIKIQFDNIGRGVNLFVPTRVSLSIPSNRPTNPQQRPSPPTRIITGRMVLVQTDKLGNSSRFKRVRAIGMSAGIPVGRVTSMSSNQAYAIYEVDRAPTSSVDSLQSASVPVFVAFISNTGNNLPSLGETTCSVSLAPAGPRGSSPGFGDASMPRKAFAIHAVSTSLLFPFVTNQNGFDTRIVIANTSLDPLGTITQAGKVTLFYYGGVAPNNPPPPPNTTTGTGPLAGVIPAGCQLEFTLSSGGGVTPCNCDALVKAASTTTLNLKISMAGFQGYIIAACQFQYCHGFAFISNGGAESQGYLALHLQRGSPPIED